MAAAPTSSIQPDSVRGPDEAIRLASNVIDTGQGDLAAVRPAARQNAHVRAASRTGTDRLHRKLRAQDRI